MGKKRKPENIGTIKGIDLLKKSRGIQDIPFRTGAHMSEKDRPRKKITPKNYDDFL